METTPAVTPPFAPFNRLKNCRQGQFLYNFHDMYIGRSLELYGEYCEGEIFLFKQVIQPGSFVVEAGCNIGTHTVFLGNHVGPGAVVAFEPQRVVFQTMCANLAINSVPNVITHQKALGNAPGTLIVPNIDYTQDANFGGLTLGKFEQGEPVDVVTLDSLNLKACHFIKIDVEGMEQQVLEGGQETINRFKPIMYIENDRPDKSDGLVRYLDKLGYDMYWHLVMYFNPENFAGNSDNVFPNMAAHNMLCIHNSIQQNLDGFRRVPVPK